MTPDERRFFNGFKNFTSEEMVCKCGNCSLPIDEPEFQNFMEKLQALRSVCGFPFQINSGYRCPDYNDSLYSGDGTHLDGPHTKGAADIGVSFERSYKLQKEAFEMEFGIGVKQHGPVGGRYVHIDDQGMRNWSYS